MKALVAAIGERTWRVAASCLPLAGLLGATPAVPVADPSAQLAALLAVDTRLATMGYRLATANAALCAERQPGTGIVLHAIDQYDADARPAARRVFGFPAPVSVELVVAGSPAARAGVVPGDGVAAVNGTPVPATAQTGIGSGATGTTRDAAWGLVAAQDPTRPLALSLLRAGRAETVVVPPLPACRAAFEVLLGASPIARSDGRIVQIGVSYLARLDDDRLAVIVAHELAHIVLHHRRRLEAAGVHWGLRAEFGGSARMFRRTEDEADALGAVLMRNAGYDPRVAVEFWRHRGGFLEIAGGAHGSAKDRAAAIEAMVASIPATAPVPWVPPLIAHRDDPLR